VPGMNVAGSGGNSNTAPPQPGLTASTSASVHGKKEEFRRYLERAGVLDALTKVLVGLYEEPDRHAINGLEYVKRYLGAVHHSAGTATAVDCDGLRRENDELRHQLDLYRQQQQAPPAKPQPPK
jgi:hypothetical protein